MENRKDIGKAFREKLSLIEKSPDAALWDRIENDLQKKQEKNHRKLIFFIVVILSVLGITIGTLSTENTSLKKGDDSVFKNEAYSGKETSDQDRQNQNSVSSEMSYSEKTNNSPKYEEGERKEGEYIETGDVKSTKIKEATKSESGKENGVTRTNGTTAATGVRAEKAIEVRKTAKSNYLKTKTETQKNNNTRQLVSNSASATGNHGVDKNTYSKAIPENKITLTSQKQRKRSKNKSNTNQNSTPNSDKEYNTAAKKTKNNGINNNETDYQIADTKKNNTPENNRVVTSANESATTTNEISTNTITDSITNNIVAACVEEMDSIQNQKKENKNPLKEQDEKEEDKKGKTKIDIIASVFYAPTVSGSLTGKSLINESFNDYSLKKTITNSFGAYLGIKNKNLGIRIGYVKVDLENSLSINNNQGNPISDYSNIILNGGITPVTINNHFASSDNVTIVQKASYANIPLEFKYTVFNKNRFGVDAIAGVSIILLEKNTLEMYGNNASKLTIGKIDNQSKMNLGLNLGIGLHYNLTKNLQLDVNPMLTYLHNVGNEFYKPYSLLLQSGFSYRF